MKDRSATGELKREIGLASALIMVIASMVGTGIFTTSGFIMKELGDPRYMLLSWFAGGLFALSGALCYGELGAMFPNTGGEYAFLRESFGPRAAFISGWISLIVGFSAPIAAASIAFATYLIPFVPWPGGCGFSVSVSGRDLVAISPVTAIAALVIALLSFVHYKSAVFGRRVQNVLTMFKVAFIVFFVIAGVFSGRGSPGNIVSTGGTGSIYGAEFAIALILVSFAYSGWNAATYLGGEIRKPGRNIPVALCGGTLVVMCLYMLLNVVYLYALSPSGMAGALDVGARSAAFLFGERAGRYFSGAIALGLLSVLSAMIMAGPRVYYAMARDGVFFKPLGKVSAARGTPTRSILFQAGISLAMVLTASFESLLLYMGFTLSLSAMVTVAGMVRLRFTMPEADRPYRTLGYPFTPILFIAGNLWIVVFSIANKPVAAFWGLITIGTGLMACLFFEHGRGDRATNTCLSPARNHAVVEGGGRDLRESRVLCGKDRRKE